MQQQPEYLKSCDVARRLDVSESAVKYWLKKGWLDHLRVGHTVRIFSDALEKLRRKAG